MEIFPAIDLMNGVAVRLRQGDFETKEVFSTRPAVLLDDFKKQGATNLHIVDLDGARDGSIENFETIKSLASRGDFFIEVGGGIRNMTRIEKYLKCGVNRIILGTVAVTDFGFVKEAVTEFGSAVAVGVDAKENFVAIHGWKTVTSENSFEFCKKCRDAKVSTVIYTDIATDGAMSGTNISAYEKLSKLEELNIIASGGISSLDEIKILKELNIYGAILGKAIYKGLINLSDAIKVANPLDKCGSAN
ncbi:MAG TPA: 1-(5-phosphoribosyl)-5-[(5-phosphoribosylamino)methylideneamino]imidazole-4-carboxamide isomerase [Clostridia bacterium]|nr:1-(5-phosphoribosyl)-5-[(5-phosphoribosylamino)methylideneamino]imidazole-4-carboxamide isomerase [Clostridia bacterium]